MLTLTNEQRINFLARVEILAMNELRRMEAFAAFDFSELVRNALNIYIDKDKHLSLIISAGLEVQNGIQGKGEYDLSKIKDSDKSELLYIVKKSLQAIGAPEYVQSRMISSVKSLFN